MRAFTSSHSAAFPTLGRVPIKPADDATKVHVSFAPFSDLVRARRNVSRLSSEEGTRRPERRRVACVEYRTPGHCPALSALHRSLRKGCLVKASHSGKVVCPVEVKWIFVQDQILSILFSERGLGRTAEPHREAADRDVGNAAEG